MILDSLKKLYLDHLRDLYSAENQLLKALPKMTGAAFSDELKQYFEDHFEQTKEHVERLDEIFLRLGEKPGGGSCKAMKGLIEEGAERLKEYGEGAVIDAGLISDAQKIEHYEIAAYGSARTFANLLGEEEAADLLQQTLEEEGEADKHLGELADDILNACASTESYEHKGSATRGF